MSITNSSLTIGQRERATQDRIVTLFQHVLGYEYLGDWSDRENNRNIEESIPKSLKPSGKPSRSFSLANTVGISASAGILSTVAMVVILSEMNGAFILST